MQKASQFLTVVVPRQCLVFLPTYCPKAHPPECLFGDRHDQVTRHHRPKQIWRLGQEGKRHLLPNGPWRYRRSEISFTAEGTPMVQHLNRQAKAIASVPDLLCGTI